MIIMKQPYLHPVTSEVRFCIFPALLSGSGGDNHIATVSVVTGRQQYAFSGD